MSPAVHDDDRAVPTHDPALFEDVDAPVPARPAPLPPVPGSSPAQAAPAPFVVIHEDGPEEPPSQAGGALPQPPRVPNPVAPGDSGAGSGAGRLYRSSGATGPLAALAIPALDRHPAGGSAPAPLPATPSAGQSLTSGSVRVYSAVDEPVDDWQLEPARHPGPVPAWLAPAPAPEDDEGAGATPARASLLGRPTFSRGRRPATKRVGDGLLLATDGLTLPGEIVLVGGAATVGALIDVIFAGSLGLMISLLLFAASLYGAWRIRPTERLMAVAVPPVAFFVATVVIGQLGLPAGRHLLTREALLLFNALSGAFLWLLATVLGCVAIVVWRSRAGRGTQVAA